MSGVNLDAFSRASAAGRGGSAFVQRGPRKPCRLQRRRRQRACPGAAWIYAPVTLTADLAQLSAKEREMVGLLIDAADIMDDLFWQQAYPGDRAALLAGSRTRRCAVSRGQLRPWDRLAATRPFVPGVGPKPPGRRFLPARHDAEEFERANLSAAAASTPCCGVGAGWARGRAVSKHYGAATRAGGGAARACRRPR